MVDAARADIGRSTRTMTLHGRDVRYVDEGHGQAVVLVHGLLGGLHDWDQQIPTLSERFRVIAPDLPGHGGSDKMVGDYSLSAHAATIRDLLRSLDIDSVTVVGHSLGGGIAMQMLYLFPELVNRICLISSGGLGQEVNPMLRAAAVPGSGFLLPIATSGPLIGGVGTVISLLERYRVVSMSAGARQSWKNFASIADPAARRAFLATARSVIDHRGQTVSANERLASFAHVPAVLIWGARDTIIPPAHAESVRDQLPDGTIEIFPGAGHFPHLDAPERFAETFHRFMDRPIPDGPATPS